MLTLQELEHRLVSDSRVITRLKTLKLAEEINPEFRAPHILGGYLRDISLGVEPKDCDVVFQGHSLNQVGILEAISKAEAGLEIENYRGWDVENSMTTGPSTDFFENTIGRCSYLTDNVTMMMLDTNGKLFIGNEKTLHDIESRIYDFNIAGIEVWANHRGKGRSYASCITGDLTRAMYLCSKLGLCPSAIVAFLLGNYDVFFSQLEISNQNSLRSYWKNRTKGSRESQEILERFKVTSLL